MREVFILTVVWLVMAIGAQAQDTGIRDTIDRQFEAFQADDFATAFGFASPDLQRFFETPENFARMVTQGYPMVWRPGAVRYLEQREEGGSLLQRVMITDRSGKVHVLDYRMIRTPEGWRISGVQFVTDNGANV